MALNEAFIQELKRESASSEKVFERIPDEKFSWKPHEKSMSFGALANHIVQLTAWITPVIQTESMDFSISQQPKPAETQAELLQNQKDYLANALAALENASDEVLLTNWKLSNGEHVIFDMPRIQVLRSIIMNHLIHHRGQLTVYLRMNDIPVPGLYGPSADEK
ncbi:MAG: DinB family protein [Janthinobacterium lividum]